MLELNQEINWVPAHVRDGAFGKWLEGARDWSITRNRFWGAPVPSGRATTRGTRASTSTAAWTSSRRISASGQRILHRPAIDELVRPNPDDPTGQSMMRRVEDVLDCWFESGSMPFAQVHYPFENAEWFEGHFPADFIVEYVGQTRGWFYTLHVLATALFDKPPFDNCMAHGIVLGDDKQKLSKRLRNYPDPDEMFDVYGADAMRWFLLSSPVIRGGDLVVERKGRPRLSGRCSTRSGTPGSSSPCTPTPTATRPSGAADATEVLDRYILAKTAAAGRRSHRRHGHLRPVPAPAWPIPAFLDALNNWYIRRSRDRFWSRVGASSASDESKTAAYDTLYTVLHTLCLRVRPAVAHGGRDGVPGPDRRAQRPSGRLARARPACPKTTSWWPTWTPSAGRVLGRSLRAQGGRPAGPAAARVGRWWPGPGRLSLSPIPGTIADELNVKEVRLSDDVSEVADLVLKVDPSVLGPRPARTEQYDG